MRVNGPFVFVRRMAGLLVQIRAILGPWNAKYYSFHENDGRLLVNITLLVKRSGVALGTNIIFFPFHFLI